MDGKKIRMELQLFPREKLLLVSRGFSGCRSSRSTGDRHSVIGVRYSVLSSKSHLNPEP